MEFKWEPQRCGNVLGPAQPYSWFSSLTLVKETLNVRRLVLLLPSFCCCSVFQLSTECESPLCSEVRGARCLCVSRTEAKLANSNSSTLASLANYCRRAKPCPLVCHLLWTPSESSRALKKNKMLGTSLTTWRASHNDAPRRALATKETWLCSNQAGVSPLSAQHSWRWDVLTCQWWKPTIRVLRENGLSNEGQREDTQTTNWQENWDNMSVHLCGFDRTSLDQLIFILCCVQSCKLRIRHIYRCILAVYG